MVIPSGTKERELIETFNDMEWLDREHLLEYAKRLYARSLKNGNGIKEKQESMVKIAEFCNIEIFMNSTFKGKPALVVHYIDDDVTGEINIKSEIVSGDFSKYVLPVIKEWLSDNKARLLKLWESKSIEIISEWE